MVGFTTCFRLIAEMDAKLRDGVSSPDEEGKTTRTLAAAKGQGNADR
jgi:hypothetical protein